ncbi:unnamed protein product [Heligmosomoides polygyrus]|uniref:GIY-YIG domain-containing protein n=1 Tax=Heligmosomoides polygyrus TaxID=6339 RepID=A0A183GJ24_HELPZ|nr:unnamed protein product [Heligmosomoides polygyrus]
MSKIEAPVVSRLPLLCCRYVDDFFIVTTTQHEMDKCFEIMNSQSEYIKLTREKPWGKEGDCTVSGVVYLISCQACGEEYIGETGRPLHVRIKEYLDGKEKLRASTALGYHRINSHGGEDFGDERSQGQPEGDMPVYNARTQALPQSRILTWAAWEPTEARERGGRESREMISLISRSHRFINTASGALKNPAETLATNKAVYLPREELSNPTDRW